MTDEELRALVERNAQAIENSARAISRLEGKTDSLNEQLSLLTRQVQVMVDVQSQNSQTLTAVNRHIQGFYDVLQSITREQNERFELIGQQIQSLIDERRNS
ncbi:MAG: Bacterial flagellin N-terminal helical region [Phormidesmis priestleyi Ana]|uniref:Bacterial flagellin N-terminal helical region n=1 Tax=Phormidesmis priestleyi Ana TaxID=1666911 RepID=A0A0P7YVW6_9CYAN|nr:MAG: Bacterial flagellin N-terminal helical region [Phormidesmis priestleyi Ana]